MENNAELVIYEKDSHYRIAVEAEFFLGDYPGIDFSRFFSLLEIVKSKMPNHKTYLLLRLGKEKTEISTKEFSIFKGHDQREEILRIDFDMNELPGKIVELISEKSSITQSQREKQIFKDAARELFNIDDKIASVNEGKLLLDFGFKVEDITRRELRRLGFQWSDDDNCWCQLAIGKIQNPEWMEHLKDVVTKARPNKNQKIRGKINVPYEIR